MAAKNFARALAATLRFEGGYSNHPSDPGGATNMGITLATLTDWRGVSVTAADVRALQKSEAAAIYRRRYWDMVNGDRLPDGIDLAVFDYAVNSGVGRATRALQSVLDVPVDGIIGRGTVEAASRANAERVIIALCNQRRGFLRRLRIFTTFGRGWLRRVAAIEALAITMAPVPVPPSLRATKENATMQNSKSLVESRTVWANIVGFSALAVSLFGFDTSDVDQAAVVDAVLKGIAGFSFVLSTIFRVRATRQLG